MKITNKQKKEVRSLIEKWRYRLFLNQWNFDILYGTDETLAGARIEMNTEYKNGKITFEPGYWDYDKNRREEVVVHELCHCLIQPLIEIACKSADGHALSQREIDWHKESVTQHITCALFYK